MSRIIRLLVVFSAVTVLLMLPSCGETDTHDIGSGTASRAEISREESKPITVVSDIPVISGIWSPLEPVSE